MYMNHPNVLKLYGFFHDSKNIYLILEYCNKCLFRELRQKVFFLLIQGKFSEEQTAYYTKQCITSLKYMHNENIIHRDIKPENILIQNEVIKMSDFGWSTYAPVQYFLCLFLVKGKLFAERLTMCLHKLFKEAAMMKELIFGLQVYCFMNLQVELLHSKQKIKTSHMKRS